MRPFTARRSRPEVRRLALVVALLAAMSVSSCGGADEDSEQGISTSDASTSSPSPTPSSTSSEQDASAARGTPIRITLGDTQLTARLVDNATTRVLAAQLPLTLTVRDHNNVDKTAPLPRKLSLDGAPEGTIPPPETSATGHRTATSSSTTTMTHRTSTASCAFATSTATSK